MFTRCNEDPLLQYNTTRYQRHNFNERIEYKARQAIAKRATMKYKQMYKHELTCSPQLKEKHIAKGEQEKDKQIMKSLLEKHDNFALNNDIERLKAHMTIKHKSMRRIDATINDLKNW